MKQSKEVVSSIESPQLAKIKAKASTLLKKWKTVKITTAESFEAAGAAAKDFALLRKDLKFYLDPIIKAAKADYDAKRKAFKSVDSIIAQGEDSVRLALEEYTIAHRKAQEAKVEKALASGNDEKAAAIAAKPYIPAVAGLSFPKRWHGEVTDFLAFLTGVIDGRLPPEAVEVNLVWLNAQARAKKSEDLGIPGARGVKETSSAVRS